MAAVRLVSAVDAFAEVRCRGHRQARRRTLSARSTRWC